MNTSFTVISHDEKTSAYNATGQMIPSDIDKKIVKVCSDQAPVQLVNIHYKPA